MTGRRRRATSAAALRGQRFGVREAEVDGDRYLYGDRHRWTKLATLLDPPRADPVPHRGRRDVRGSATSRASSSPRATSLTVQPIGTPGLLVVKNYDFEAPGLRSRRARRRDFTTDLGVFQNGQEIARKTIRVNDPLAVAGYTFHQNGFGPAPDLADHATRTASRCGTGPCR